VALSRARLGLYILGRREVFEPCFELREAFELLLQRPDKLTLVTGELWPSSRILFEEEGKEVPGKTVMEGVEHLGQYVFDMTNTRIKQLRAERGLPEDVATPQEPLPQPLPDEVPVEVIEPEDAEEAVAEAQAEGFEAEED
jgi:intron-binding protein aquarius